MTRRQVWLLTALLFLCAPIAEAQNFSLNRGDFVSAFRDVSTLSFGSYLGYTTHLSTPSEASDLYINQISLTPGENWHPDLDLNVATTGFNWYDYSTNQNGSYTVGTPIPAGVEWNFDPAYRNGAVADTVPDGVYTTALNIYGGASPDAFDSLASFNLSLEVYQKLDIAVETSASPDTIVRGEATQLSMTVHNNMTDRDFVSTTWFISGFSDGTNQLPWTTFDGNWFGQHIAPGDSRTDLHSTWKAALNQPSGDYFGTNGVVGGLHEADFYFINSAQTRITVVPGPSALVVAGMGIMPLVPFLRRRRK